MASFLLADVCLALPDLTPCFLSFFVPFFHCLGKTLLVGLSVALIVRGDFKGGLGVWSNVKKGSSELLCEKGFCII